MSDIVERLKEPEIHYPGNFDTPKRANAMLSCLCQEAAEEIESLRIEVERLKKSRQDALDSVRNELVAIGLLPTERGWLAHEGRKDCLTLEAELMFMRESGYLHLLATHEELAASQAREQKLREALQELHYACKCEGSWENCGVMDDSREAIALPQDNTAIKAMITKAGDVMRERCCKVVFSYPKATEIAIRALPEITLDDMK